MKKEEKVVLKEVKKTIDLNDFNKKVSKDQLESLEEILNNIYGTNLVVSKKDILKVLKLSCYPKDKTIYLPYSLKASKVKDKIVLSYSKKKLTILIMICITAFILTTMASTYAGLQYRHRNRLNKDINGDGIPDINIDINNDYVAEINIDNDNDNKPDTNIDYKGNHLNVFNIDSDSDGVPDFNLINQDLNNDNVCDLNCDSNDDGWPDYNFDLDGDGIADIDIDTDNDKKPDLNLDINGDGKCDLWCDTNGDLVCDIYCTESPKKGDNKPTENDNIEIDVIENGNNSSVSKTAELILTFDDISEVFAENIFPDDQEGFESIIPSKIFTIENKSDYTLKYKLYFNVLINDFESSNFKFKVSSTNGGGEIDWTTTPKVSGTFLTEIVIQPKSIQKYTVDFKLQGINEPQNYDQGKTFRAIIKLGV